MNNMDSMKNINSNKVENSNNHLFLLLKTMFKTEDILQLNLENKGKAKQILKLILIGLGVLAISFSLSAIFYPLYITLEPLGLGKLIVRLILLGASIISTFLSLWFIVNAFYFSQDIENLIYLPVKEGHIVLSKLILVTVYEILSTVLFFYPSLVVYGIAAKVDALFYVKSLISIILIPVLPMAVIGIFSILLMRYSKFFKNKERFSTIITAVTTFMGIGISIISQLIGNNGDKNMIIVLTNFLNGNSIGGKVTKYLFPAAHFLGNDIFTDRFFINLLFILAICVAVLVIFYLVGNKFYFDGARGLQESSSGRKKLSLKQMESSTRKKPAVISLAIKEWKLIKRVPSFLMNGVLPMVMAPLFLALPFITQKENMGLLTSELSGKLDFSAMEIYLGVVLFMMAFNLINFLSPTVISREGSNFYVMKYIPVPYRTQIIAKTLPPFVLTEIVTFVIITVLALLLKVNMLHVLVGYILGSIGAFAMGLFSTLLDILRPNLKWITEIKALKQNFNVIMSFILLAIFGLLFYFLTKLNIEITTVFMVFYSVVIVLLVIYLLLLEKICKWSFKEKN